MFHFSERYTEAEVEELIDSMIEAILDESNDNPVLVQFRTLLAAAVDPTNKSNSEGAGNRLLRQHCGDYESHFHFGDIVERMFNRGMLPSDAKTVAHLTYRIDDTSGEHNTDYIVAAVDGWRGSRSFRRTGSRPRHDSPFNDLDWDFNAAAEHMLDVLKAARADAILWTSMNKHEPLDFRASLKEMTEEWPDGPVQIVQQQQDLKDIWDFFHEGREGWKLMNLPAEILQVATEYAELMEALGEEPEPEFELLERFGLFAWRIRHHLEWLQGQKERSERCEQQRAQLAAFKQQEVESVRQMMAATNLKPGFDEQLDMLALGMSTAGSEATKEKGETMKAASGGAFGTGDELDMDI